MVNKYHVQWSYIQIIGMFMLIGCLALQPSGCLLLLGAGAGAGGVAYVMGDLEEEIEATVPKLQRATVAGLAALHLPVENEHGDKLSAVINSKTADNSKIKINISSLTPSRSKISIRVGLIGNEMRSRQILKSLKMNL